MCDEGEQSPMSHIKNQHLNWLYKIFNLSIHNAHNRRLARQLFHLAMPLRKTLYTTQNTKPILATWQANIHKPEKIAQFCVQQTWCLFHFPL